MEVAVKKAPASQWPGRMPINEKGMAVMMTIGVVKD